MCDPATHEIQRCWCGARSECHTCGDVRGNWFRHGGFVLVGRADDTGPVHWQRELAPPGHTAVCMEFHYEHNLGLMRACDFAVRF